MLRGEVFAQLGQQDRRVADPVGGAFRQLRGDDADRDVLRLQVDGDAGVAVDERVLEFPAVGDRDPEGVVDLLRELPDADTGRGGSFGVRVGGDQVAATDLAPGT
jgi:hypothetical protein